MPLEPESTEVARPPRKRGARIALLALAMLLLIVAGVGGWASYALIQGDLPLTFLRGRMEEAARSRMPDDAVVRLGSVNASYRPGSGLVVRLRNLSVSLPKRAVMTIESVAIGADAAALLSRHISARSVRIEGIDVALGGGGAAGDIRTVADLRAAAGGFARAVVGADDDLRAVGLASVEARDIGITFGGAGGRRLAIADASWMPLGTRSKAWLQVISDEGAGWDLTLERSPGRAGNSVTFEAEDMPVAAVAPILADPERRPNFDGMFAAEARIALDKDGELQDFRGTLSGGGGAFSVGEADAIQVTSASVGFALGATGDRVQIPAGEIRTLTGSLRFQGYATRNDPDEPITLVTRIRGGALPTGHPDDPMTILRTGGLIARIQPAIGEVSIERFDVATDSGSASAVGQVSFGGPAPGLSLALSLSAMPAADMRALWPPFVASKTRRWFDENVVSGIVGPATLQVSLPAEFMGEKGRGRPLPSYALAGVVPFTQATFSPFRTFPKIVGADGDIAFSSGAATIMAMSGSIDVGSFGSVDPTGTTMMIGELGRSEPFGNLHLELSGSAAALARLSNTPPLHVTAARGIVADDLSGDARLSLDAEIPLTSHADMSKVAPTFRLALAGFSSKKPIEGRQIEEADLILEGRPESYTVKGQGRIDGIAATLDLIAGSAAEGSADVRLTLDEEARKKLGLGLEDFLAGPVTATLRQTGSGTLSITLDLRRARIMLPFAGWEKGAGVPAEAVFEMEEAADGAISIRNLQLAGEGFKANGRVEIGADRRIADIELSEAALRPGDRLSVRLTRKGDGYDLRIDGSKFDARGVIEAAKSGMGADNSNNPTIRIAVQIGAAVGRNGVTANDVAGVVELGRRGVQTASLHGKVNGQNFDWAVDRKGDRRSLRLTADSGGGLIRFLGIYDKVAGGTMIMEYSGSVSEERGSGSVVMRDFRILEEPALAPALQPAQSAAARGGGAAPVNPGDLAFDRLVIPFGRQKGIIAIDEAHLRGPVIGATGSGTLNLTARKVAVSGTFIPIFGLNNIAGSIPILGTILGGGRNEGLLGITYKLFGPLDNPTLTMNPLSAIAPGIFRKLFEYR